MSNVSTIRLPKRALIGNLTAGKKVKRKTAKLSLPGGKIVLVGSLAICLLSLVALRSTITKSEARLIVTQRQHKKLLSENRRFQQEWRYLKSPVRMEQLAKCELGLQPPSKEQIVIIK
ncbi:MAG: cell division protein FtsL [Thermodesulfobacteriota bacterium]